MANNPLIRPYFLGGGGIGGVPLDSHEHLQKLRGSIKMATSSNGSVGGAAER